MSYAHAECARLILAQVKNPGDSKTRTQLNEAVKYHGKNETNFGATLVDLVQGGILDENKIPLRPTIYMRTTKQLPVAAKVAGAQPPIVAANSAPTKDAAKGSAPRWKPESAARRAAILQAMRAGGYEQVTCAQVLDFGLHKKVTATNVWLDLTCLVQAGHLMQVDGSMPKAWRIPTKLVEKSASPFATAAEAPAAEPARAPGERAAPGRAADLADWQNMDAYLADASHRATDCKTAYIQSVTDSTVLRQMDAAITSTEAALRIHRQRKPA